MFSENTHSVNKQYVAVLRLMNEYREHKLLIPSYSLLNIGNTSEIPLLFRIFMGGSDCLPSGDAHGRLPSFIVRCDIHIGCFIYISEANYELYLRKKIGR